VRVESGPAPLVEARDLILVVAGVPTAGFVGRAAGAATIFDGTPIRTLREPSFCSARAKAPCGPSTYIGDDTARGRRKRRPLDVVGALGDGRALVVDFADVPDDLGDMLARDHPLRAKGTEMPAGIVARPARQTAEDSTGRRERRAGFFLPGVACFR